jgi:hypothetical protein
MTRLAQDFLACLLVLVLMLTGLAQGVHAARGPGSVVICATAGPAEVPLPDGAPDHRPCPDCLPPSLGAAPATAPRAPALRVAAVAWRDPASPATAQPQIAAGIRGPPAGHRA